MKLRCLLFGHRWRVTRMKQSHRRAIAWMCDLAGERQPVDFEWIESAAPEARYCRRCGMCQRGTAWSIDRSGGVSWETVQRSEMT